MWIILTLFLFQEDISNPEPMNALIYLNNGDRHELVSADISGVEAFSFQFTAEGQTSFVSIYDISRITRVKNSQEYELLYLDGTKKKGQIRPFMLQGFSVINMQDKTNFNIRDIDRVHFVTGAQLRSCTQGHYEEYTPHPFCPVCGILLDLGPFHENRKKQYPVTREHMLRADPRNQ